MTAAQLSQALEQIQVRRHHLRHEADQIAAAAARNIPDTRSIEQLCKDLATNIDSFSPGDQQHLLRLLHVKVELSTDHIRIPGRLPGNYPKSNAEIRGEPKNGGDSRSGGIVGKEIDHRVRNPEVGPVFEISTTLSLRLQRSMLMNSDAS